MVIVLCSTTPENWCFPGGLASVSHTAFLTRSHRVPTHPPSHPPLRILQEIRMYPLHYWMQGPCLPPPPPLSRSLSRNTPWGLSVSVPHRHILILMEKYDCFYGFISTPGPQACFLLLFQSAIPKKEFFIHVSQYLRRDPMGSLASPRASGPKPYSREVVYQDIH